MLLTCYYSMPFFASCTTMKVSFVATVQDQYIMTTVFCFMLCESVCVFVCMFIYLSLSLWLSASVSRSVCV